MVLAIVLAFVAGIALGALVAHESDLLQIVSNNVVAAISHPNGAPQLVFQTQLSK